MRPLMIVVLGVCFCAMNAAACEGPGYPAARPRRGAQTLMWTQTRQVTGCVTSCLLRGAGGGVWDAAGVSIRLRPQVHEVDVNAVHLRRDSRSGSAESCS